jgi:glycine oxidase
MRVTVVGAGVIGLAVAEALAQRGVEVTVLDMRAPGLGASQASAGILAPFTEAHDGSPLLALGVRSLDLYDDFVGRISEASRLAIAYARTGTLDVALVEEEAPALEEREAWLEARGVASELIEGDALRVFEPCLAASAAAALHVPTHGFVGVESLVRALVACARQAGAVVEHPVEVTAIEPRPDAVTIRTTQRVDEADAVVLAAGSWSARVPIDGVSSPPVRPVRGQLLHLRWPDAAPPARVVWGSGCYAVPWADGSLLVGATVEEAGFDEQPTDEGVSALTSAVHALLPATRTALVDHVRVGLRPALPDALPAIGAFAQAPRVIAAMGHFRNGVLLAPITAELVARLVLDEDADPILALTSPDRFGP